MVSWDLFPSYPNIGVLQFYLIYTGNLSLATETTNEMGWL